MPANAKPRTFLVKRARAERILAMRAAGATQEQVARALDCSVETVRRTERWAEQNGLLEAAQDKFIRMLGKAGRVYDETLDGDNPKLRLEAARDIAFGTGVLKRNHESAAPTNVEEESLTLILKRRRERLSSAAPEGDSDSGRPVVTEEPAAEPSTPGGDGALQRFIGAAADGEVLDQDAPTS